jgi:hypothetical protein
VCLRRERGKATQSAGGKRKGKGRREEGREVGREGGREGGRAYLNLLTAITTKPSKMAKRKRPMLRSSNWC